VSAVAVVTGASRGIGLAVARELAGRGFTVVQGARDPASAPRVEGNVLVRRLDVTDAESIERLADELERVDVLVNHAAILYDTRNRAATVDLGSGHGCIVNVSSGAGSLATMGGGTPAYQVSKAALNAFTRTLAGELRGDGILVNAVCPGWVATDMGGPGGRPVEEGAASVVWAALLPDDGPTGGFFRDGRPVDW
jgi:NAD(P)-dependent dehydrogenase (short-subunit alcohol dehydrogenase family)